MPCLSALRNPAANRVMSSSMRRRLVASAIGVVCVAFRPIPADAQRIECALKVDKVSGPVGYQQRDYGCEGFFVQAHANLNVQVLSLRQGPLPIDSADVLLIAVPATLPDSLAARATVFGAGLTSGLNWALDGPLNPKAPMRWRVSEVVRAASLPATSIGLMARTVSGARFAVPWYVAVRTARSQAAIDAVGIQRELPTDLVVHIPAAGRLRCRAQTTAAWIDATALDGDGRFNCPVPGKHHGAVELQVSWAPRGTLSWSDIETLRLWLW